MAQRKEYSTESNMTTADRAQILKAVSEWVEQQAENIPKIRERTKNNACSVLGLYGEARESFEISNIESLSDRQLKILCNSFFSFAVNLGYLSLIEAAYKNHLMAFINLQDTDGWTPLCRAISASDIHVVKYLLEHGADIHHTWKSMDLLKHAIRQVITGYPKKDLKEKRRTVTQGIMQWMLDHPRENFQAILCDSLDFALRGERLDFKTIKMLMLHNKNLNQSNYFFHLAMHQSLKCVLFFVKQYKEKTSAFLNAQNAENQTPLEVFFQCHAPIQDWLEHIQLYLALGTEVTPERWRKIKDLYKETPPHFRNRDEKSQNNYIKASTALFLRFSTETANLNLVSSRVYQALLDNDLLNPKMIYLVYGKSETESKIIYASQNGDFLEFDHCYSYQLFKKGIWEKNLFNDDYGYLMIPEISNTVRFLVLSDKQERGLPVDLSGLNVLKCKYMKGYFDWRFQDISGMTFNLNWLLSPDKIKSLLGVKISMESLKNNKIEIDENPGLVSGFKRYGGDFKKLKIRAVRHYQSYFSGENSFYTILNTLSLFINDVTHFVRIHQDAVKPLFGETESFKAIMQAGQARLLELSKSTEFKWNSTHSPTVVSIFKKNYLSVENPITTIMQISTVSTHGFLGVQVNSASASRHSSAEPSPSSASELYNKL